MPRSPRTVPGGYVYHVLNRGNGRQLLFHKPADYHAFLAMMQQVREKIPMRILGYCLMPNHWHLVLWPREDGDLSRFMLRLSTTHVRRHHAHYHNQAGGHLYQGRFKSFIVQEDHHLLLLLRYVEANPLRAMMAREPHGWPWTSFAARSTPAGAALLDDWPIDRPRNWRQLLRERIPDEQLEEVHTSLQRGRPLGGELWTNRIARRLGLEFTMRPRGRPRKRS